MTIKITDFIRDPNNPDMVKATIDYDINGVIYHYDIYAQMSAIEPLSIQDIANYVKNQVAVQRGDQLWNNVNTKLNQIKNVELEP